MIEGCKAEVERNESQNKVEERSDVSRKDEGVGQVHGGHLVQPVGIVLAVLGGMDPGEFRVTGIAALHPGTDCTLESPQEVTESLGMVVALGGPRHDQNTGD